MAETNDNGGVTWRWVLGLFVTGFVMVGGFAWSSTLDRLIDVEATSRARGERLAILETEHRAFRDELLRMRDGMENANRKLDELLGRR